MFSIVRIILHKRPSIPKGIFESEAKNVQVSQVEARGKSKASGSTVAVSLSALRSLRSNLNPRVNIPSKIY